MGCAVRLLRCRRGHCTFDETVCPNAAPWLVDDTWNEVKLRLCCTARAPHLHGLRIRWFPARCRRACKPLRSAVSCTTDEHQRPARPHLEPGDCPHSTMACLVQRSATLRASSRRHPSSISKRCGLVVRAAAGVRAWLRDRLPMPLRSRSTGDGWCMGFQASNAPASPVAGAVGAGLLSHRMH